MTKNTTAEGIFSNSMTFFQFIEVIFNYEQKHLQKIETGNEN
jgi:hypothetical protein